MIRRATPEMLRRELASLDGEIDEMIEAARVAWNQGNVVVWLAASRLALAWRLRRWLLQRGVPLPIRFDDPS